MYVFKANIGDLKSNFGLQAHRRSALNTVPMVPGPTPTCAKTATISFR